MTAERLCRVVPMLVVVFTWVNASASAAELPHTHPYQQQLRDYLATLTERDFEHGVSEKLSIVPGSVDPEEQLRNHMLTMMLQPLVGTKRAPPSVNCPAKLFTLATIESGDVLLPPVHPETLASFVKWNYPGNPYFENRALKMRAFVTAVVMLIMTDDYLEKNPPTGNTDKHSSQLIYTSMGYLVAKDLLPAEARTAFETGLRKLGTQIWRLSPRGENAHLDLVAPIGQLYVAKALEPSNYSDVALAQGHMQFRSPKYFHPAGYFIERGGIDVGYQGTSNYFATGAALASKWDFAQAAVDRIYRLRAHVCLPEPDGVFVGPSNFNTKIGSDAWGDQWAWGGMRDIAAAMLTDEALYLVKMPTPEVLAGAAAARAGAFNWQLGENPVRADGAGFVTNDEIISHPWSWRLWTSYHFPASVNFGYEFYRPGTYARWAKLHAENSPLWKSPFLRDETFIRAFEKVFVVARQPSYAAIVHTGPVGRQSPDDGLQQFAGPLGLGGGELSAFWTPATGSVLLGRRAGMNTKVTFDKLEEWRTWPSHAVFGCTTDGKFFTSGRIVDPAVEYDIQPNSAQVEARGVLPAESVAGHAALAGQVEYSRKFQLDEGGVSVETTLTGDGKDQIAELYEVLPVFLREAALQPSATPTKIEYQAGDAWAPLTDTYAEGVSAIRLTRFDGAVQIKFDRPRRVKLSPADWSDTFISRAACRNVLVDLLETADRPSVVKEARQIQYRIEPVARPAG